MTDKKQKESQKPSYRPRVAAGDKAERADQAWDKEDFEKALVLYEEAYEIDPDYNYALFGIACSLLELDKPETALPHFRSLLKEEDDEADIWNHYGLALMGARDDDEALKAFEKATILDPSLAAPFANLGILYRDMRKYDQAVKAFESFLERSGNPALRDRAEKDLEELKKEAIAERNRPSRRSSQTTKAKGPRSQSASPWDKKRRGETSQDEEKRPNETRQGQRRRSSPERDEKRSPSKSRGRSVRSRQELPEKYTPFGVSSYYNHYEEESETVEKNWPPRSPRKRQRKQPASGKRKASSPFPPKK